MSKRQTLLDIANRAGVSPRTVSNVVNGYVPVSDKLRKRVEQAVDDLGYRPNFMARSLRNGRSGLIALVVPEIDVPYFAELSRTIIESADPLGYRVMIDQTAGQMLRERSHIAKATQSTLFDGIIFSPLALSPSDLAAIAGNTPFVVLGEHSHEGLFDHVALDNLAAASDVIAHLHSIGRTRIAAIGQGTGPADGTKQLRFEGYQRGLQQQGLEFDPALVPQSALSHRELGFDATLQLIDNGVEFDALFCFSDLAAVGAIRALTSRGVRIPDDVAVVGWDDIAEASFTNPPLTTVSPDKAQLASTTLAYLIDRMTDPSIPPRDFVIAHTLEIRESSVGRSVG